jgi:hypothetical protein
MVQARIEDFSAADGARQLLFRWKSYTLPKIPEATRLLTRNSTTPDPIPPLSKTQQLQCVLISQ